MNDLLSSSERTINFEAFFDNSAMSCDCVDGVYLQRRHRDGGGVCSLSFDEIVLRTERKNKSRKLDFVCYINNIFCVIPLLMRVS